ncbi:hypothetical protein JL720_13392 [Aureococcus anophagefferens]|nr:hypothetical protein JL720_13392 [Aureococcus anophagefferens]
MYASAEVVECYDAKGEDVCVARFSDGAVCEAVLAEAIPESEAQLCDAVPVAEIFGADAFGDESDDDKGCVEVKLSELCARVDLDGVKRRALELRDCLFCDRAFRLRGDAAAGGLEDVEAVARARSISDLLSFVNSYVAGPDAELGGDAVGSSSPFTTDDGTKETKAEPAFAPRADRDEPKAEANMGGAVVSRELFPGREEYENWSLDCVQQTMAQLKAEHGTIYDRAMDRSHYFNLFNNYEHQNAVTGSFMTLPMDHFSRYLTGEAETSDDGGLRVCGVLKGDVKPKDIADMADNVWKRADGPAANGGTGATTSLPVAKLWALCQNDFSKHGLIFAMLRGDFRATMRVVRNSGEFVKKGPKKLDADSSSDRFKRARARHSIRQVRNRAEAEAGKKIDALLEDTHDPDAASHAVRQDVKNRKKKLNAVATTKALTDLMIATDMAFTDLLDLRETFFNVTQVQPAIHGGSKVISVEQLTELLLARFQNLEDGRVLQRATRAFDVNRDGKVDFDEFVIGMARFMPTDDVAAQLAYIFSLYDVNRDGNVELWEVTDVLEDHEDDLGNVYEHCLKVNWKLDLNGDGKITMGEFFKVMGSEKIYINYCWNSLPPLHPAIAAATATLVACFRAKEHDATDTPRGAVQVAPLGRASLSPDDPRYAELAIVGDANLKPGPGQDKRAKFPTSKAHISAVFHSPGPNADVIRAWIAAYPEFVLMEAADEATCVELACKWLGVDRDAAADGAGAVAAAIGADTVAGAIGAVFAIVERDRDSPVAPVDPRGVWAAVGKALCVTYVDKSRILYKLIDDDADDDDTSIKLEEVTRYIHNVKDRYAQLVGYTIDHFDDLDADHDGVVTQQELVDKVLHDPRLLQLFSLIFFF